jgi:hypothetical protein
MSPTNHLAARVLFNANLLLQGAVLASTAIEKYLRAILAFRRNESHGHLKKAHWNAALNFDSRLSAILNNDFPTLARAGAAQAWIEHGPLRVRVPLCGAG